MNFAGREGGDPVGGGELGWDYGYQMFWVVLCVVTVAVLCCMYKTGMLKGGKVHTIGEAVKDDEEANKREEKRQE
eukprot:SAG22_NODE_6842_length_805_cov_1.049575_2_plen_74_part_01